jgi:hypothetical protein
MTIATAARAKGEAGFTLIDILFAIALIGLITSLAIPGMMQARGAAQSASALGTLRVINSAELSFAITCGLGFYSPDFPTLAVKPPGSSDAFLAPEMATGMTFVKGGYNFSLAGIAVPGAPAGCNGLPAGQASAGYAVVADQMFSTPVGRYFGTNADGVIYEHNLTLAGVMPETGAPPNGSPLK